MKSVSVFLMLFFSFSAFALETHTLEFEGTRPNHKYTSLAEYLEIKDFEAEKLENFLESFKDSKKPLNITLKVSTAELTDEDGTYLSSRVGLHRALRLRVFVRYFFGTNAPDLQIKVKLYPQDKMGPPNLATITITEE